MADELCADELCAYLVSDSKCSLTKLFRSFLLGYASGSFTRGIDVVIITFIYMLFLFFKAKEYK